MNYGNPLSSSDSEMASNVKKNRPSTFEKMNMHCYSLKIYEDALFHNRSKIPDFVLRPLKSMLNFELYRLSLQQLEYEMDRADYPVDFNFFEIGYCGYPNFPYANIEFKKATNLIL